LFFLIAGIKTNMLLITFLGLIVTLTSVSGECNVGTQHVKDFDWNKVGVRLFTGILKEAALENLFWFY